MSKQIFINLAVNDLHRSMEFYTAMGFHNNPQFSDDAGKCMVWSEQIYVMLLSHEKFSGFATKPIADTKTRLAALYSLSFESVEEMNAAVDKALKAGGTEPHPLRDLGFMQQRSVEDPDGHTWELFYMDLSKIPASEHGA